MLDEGHMSVEIYAKRSLGEDDMVGKLKESVDVVALLGDGNSEIRIRLVSNRHHLTVRT
jgi:hypothetical protein